MLEESSQGLYSHAHGLLKESPLKLDQHMISIIEESIRWTCKQQNWGLRIVRVLATHVHVVLVAPQVTADKVMGMLKADATACLRQLPNWQERTKWWTREGSKRILYTEAAVAAAEKYVFDQQHSWKKKHPPAVPGAFEKKQRQ